MAKGAAGKPVCSLAGLAWPLVREGMLSVEGVGLWPKIPAHFKRGIKCYVDLAELEACKLFIVSNPTRILRPDYPPCCEQPLDPMNTLHYCRSDSRIKKVRIMGQDQIFFPIHNQDYALQYLQSGVDLLPWLKL